ncbi:MAG: MHYT domain-containing protein, partial [Pseudonocardiales bacterium]
MLVAILPMASAMPGMSSGTSTAFDPTLVALSFVISVFGSLCGLQSARRARSRTGGASIAWLAAAAISIGGGAIWSMHFIGMLAYHSDVTFSFDITRTLLSLVVAAVASGIGLYIASRGQQSVLRFLGAGTITGLGVAGMHYLGMSAMQMNANLTYHGWVVAASLLIAVVAASVALFFAFTITRVWAMIAASVVMAIGICGMHYTGMAAAIVTPKLDLAKLSSPGVNPLSLALPVFGIASVLLFVLLFVGLFDDVDPSEPLA